MADNDLKVGKNLSLQPTIISWLVKKAATETIKAERTVSASEVANEILRKAMEEDGDNEDNAHLRKMLKKNILKQRT